MKNRTVTGIICMVLAAAVTFIAAPAAAKLSADSVQVPRLKTGVKQGTLITADMLETVKAAKGSLPSGTLRRKADIEGKYAGSDLYAGDFLSETKLRGESGSADDVFASLDGGRMAMSVTIDSFAAGLSGKLRNGDIISLVVYDKNSGTAVIPGEFTYVKVITTTTAGGVDQDSVVKNDDGTYDLPETVTVLVNAAQAKLLAKYESDYSVHASLVYRGSAQTADAFAAAQDEWFANAAAAAAGTEGTAPASAGADPVAAASSIINGNAAYYGVQEGDGNG